MRRILTGLTLTLALVAGLTLHAQLPGPPVGAPQANQNASFGYNFQYAFTPSSTTGSGVRVAPTLNLTTATSQNDDLLTVAGSIVLPNSSASVTTGSGLHVGTLVCTLNSGAMTNCANAVIDAAPSTGTNKYALWVKDVARYDGAISDTALTNQIVTGTGSNLTTLNFPASSGAVTLTFPTTTDTIVGAATTNSLTNKTFGTGGVGFTNATSGTVTVAPPTGALGTPTLTLPTFSSGGGLPVVIDCGSTGTGNQTCTPTTTTGLTKIIAGHSTLSTNAAVVTLPASSAFTGTATYDCVGNDVTTRANPVQVVQTSASTFTITNTTGGSDVIEWVCVGN